MDGYGLELKANLCREDGTILYIERSDEINFDILHYGSFSISGFYRFDNINLEELDHIEVYPCITKHDYIV